MVSELKALNERNQAFALICALREGDKGTALLEYLAEPSEKLRGVVGELAKLPKAQLKKELWDPLAGSSSAREALLEYAEAGWILENFRNEPPRVWVWLLTQIPKAKAGRILSGLSKETRKALKSIRPGFLSEELKSYLRKKFDERFPRVSLQQLKGGGLFEKLISLKTDQVLHLIRELGLTEISIAFSKINRSATRAILHRLNMEDAKELKNRIKEGGEYKLAMQREAQLNILSLELDKVKPGELTYEIGFSILSKAFSKEDLEVAPLFTYKLPQRQGYIFKRYIDQNAPTIKPDQATPVRERILEALERIEKEWD
jgi:hypothetical protein